jgi:hypothetical protein
MAVECANVLKLGDIAVCSGKNPQSGLQNLLFCGIIPVLLRVISP